jgi:penicillin-binding protein 2
MPDLVYCLAIAWTIRRPDEAPRWAILALGLAGDVMISRPPGIGALGLLLAAEAARSSAARCARVPSGRSGSRPSASSARFFSACRPRSGSCFSAAPPGGTCSATPPPTAVAYPALAALLVVMLGMRGARRPSNAWGASDEAPQGPAPRVTRRGLMLLGLQFGVVGALGWRMRDLQIEQNERFALLAEENRINIRLIPPARGLIFDREGRPLAMNRQNYRIVMVREQAGEPEAVLARLARIIELPPERRERALREMNARSAFVPVVVAENLSWDDTVRVSANAPVLPGVIAEVGLSRFYPDAYSTAHVVGYVGPVSERDLAELEDPDPVLQIPRFQIGKTGVEHRLEPDMRGQAGNVRIEVSAGGRVMRELGRVEGTAGHDIQLTIDKGVQNFAMQRMAGESAASVVIDVTNGDLIALASSPGFDPNSFVFGIRSGEWNALLNDEYRPLSNKTVAGAYPPGSTFKMVVALAALEAGLVRPGDAVSCGGSTALGGRRFHCWKKGGHGRVDLRKSLSQSCDVYYYEMARRLGADAISAMAKRLGLGIAHDLPMPPSPKG